MNKDLKKVEKESRYLVKESKRILQKYNAKLSADQLEPLQNALNDLQESIENQKVEGSRQALKALEYMLDNDYRFARKSVMREWAESLIFALVIALFLRTFVLEAFKIPSGSMIPTLLVGDHIFVNKFIYGVRLPFVGKRIMKWNEPKRGEVIVFAYPHDQTKDYIKRVIGLPGDTVKVSGQKFFVNGEEIKQGKSEKFYYTDETTGQKRASLLYKTNLGDSLFDTIYEPGRHHPEVEYVVQEDHLFVMGDNRDNSADSRSWGQVPFDNIKGRAILVWWSSASHDGMRLGRIGHLIE